MTLADMTLADYFVEKAEQCFQLAKFARGHVLSIEIARGIDALAEELMNKAVEIDTMRQRTEAAAMGRGNEKSDLLH